MDKRTNTEKFLNKKGRHSNEFRRTSFTNSGRIAGHGMLHDNYSEESYRGVPHESYQPDPKLNKYTQEEWEELTKESEVVTYYISKEEAKEK